MLSRFQKKEIRIHRDTQFSSQVTLWPGPVLEAAFSTVSIIIKQGNNSFFT